MGSSYSFTNFEFQIYNFLYQMCVNEFFFNWQTEKKTVLDLQDFLFQLPKLKKNCGQNWVNKLVKTSD